jgi:hypothetical protein
MFSTFFGWETAIDSKAFRIPSDNTIAELWLLDVVAIGGYRFNR